MVFLPIMLGMLFFLIYNYNGDKFLAFGITSIVWCVEVFSLICLRSSQGLAYFPYFYFLLFLLFHVYQSAFSDHGFVYVALTVVWCFILHLMVFFWHRYELPALMLGAVTIDRPRMNASVNTNVESNANNTNTNHRYPDHDSNNNSNSNNSDRNSNNDNHRDPSVDNFYTGGGGGAAAPSVLSVSSNRSHSQQQPQHDGHSSSDNGRNDATTLAQHQDHHQQQQVVLRNGSSGKSIDENNQFTVPLHLTGRNTAGGGATFLPSSQSFLSTASSRRTWGLYQHNQEDDGSTGSHLYFMGGEAVVHQQTTSTRDNSNSNSNGDLSPPVIRRGASFGNEAGDPRNVFISRSESKISLLSSTSDVNHGCGVNANNAFIGLDVPGRGRGDQEEDDDNDDDLVNSITTTENHDAFASLPNDTSMDTIPLSNLSTPQKHSRSNGTSSNGLYNGEGTDNNDNSSSGTAPASVSAEDYAQESGGLQAIFESTLTPRVRNTHHQQAEREGESQYSWAMSKEHHPQLEEQQHRQSSPSNGMPYQRRPPTFPELTRSMK